MKKRLFLFCFALMFLQGCKTVGSSSTVAAGRDSTYSNRGGVQLGPHQLAVLLEIISDED